MVDPLSSQDILKFTVKDTGRGIKEEDMSSLFKMFQAKKMKNFQYTGVGLGLSYCKAIIQEMGGKIECKSTFGEGTQFQFTLKAAYNE